MKPWEAITEARAQAMSNAERADLLRSMGIYLMMLEPELDTVLLQQDVDAVRADGRAYDMGFVDMLEWWLGTSGPLRPVS